MLLVGAQAKRGPSARAAPTSPSTVPKSAISAEETPSRGGLPQRSGAARSSGAARRGRVAHGTAVLHRGVEFCPARHRRDFVSTGGMGTQGKTHKQREHDYYLTPGDPILVEVAFPSASFNFDVDFWWSLVWSFTPCKIVTMFVSSTIPAITISSRM